MTCGVAFNGHSPFAQCKCRASFGSASDQCSAMTFENVSRTGRDNNKLRRVIGNFEPRTFASERPGMTLLQILQNHAAQGEMLLPHRTSQKFGHCCNGSSFVVGGCIRTFL